MMLTKKLMRLGVVALLFVSLFSSCEEDFLEPIIDALPEEIIDDILELDITDDTFSGNCEDLCFDITFPVNVTMPDGTTETAVDETELEAIFENYYTENPTDTTSYPQLGFPLNLTLEDGTAVTVTSEEEFEEIIISCFDDENWEDNEDDFEECFTYVYPLNVTLPDGSIEVANNEDELWGVFENWFESTFDDSTSTDFPEITYPFDVELADGSTQTITNEDDFGTVIDNCFGEEFEDCFVINFPITVAFPDGSLTVVNSMEEGEQAYESWFESNPESEEEPVVVYPITITLDDGTTQTINTEEELCAAFEACYDEDFIDNPIGLMMDSSSLSTKAIIKQFKKD